MMKPVPKSKTEKPVYPSRRDFLSLVGMASLAVPAAAFAGAELRGRIAAPRDDKKKRAFCAKTCGKEIDAQVKLLGNEDFNVRKQATAKLIAIGKAEGEDKQIAAKKKALVLAKMKALKTAKDPEIVQRAKAIMLAVNPPPKPAPRRPIEVFKGEVAIDH